MELSSKGFIAVRVASNPTIRSKKVDRLEFNDAKFLRTERFDLMKMLTHTRLYWDASQDVFMNCRPGFYGKKPHARQTVDRKKKHTLQYFGVPGYQACESLENSESTCTKCTRMFRSYGSISTTQTPFQGVLWYSASRPSHFSPHSRTVCPLGETCLYQLYESVASPSPLPSLISMLMRKTHIL